MDDFLILIVGLLVMAVFLSAIVLPIVALVISIRSRKTLKDLKVRGRAISVGPGRASTAADLRRSVTNFARSDPTTQLPPGKIGSGNERPCCLDAGPGR